ncbi:MAG: cell division protein FtsI/penicillin-binding protein 2 [Clostridium sp.]|jgi:cell division protein FtsI/penicillin-binding protein 2
MYNRNNTFGFSNQRKEMKIRTWSIMIIFMLLLCFLTWKITNLMYFKSEPLKTMANAQYTIDEKYGLQYNLIDCNGLDLLNYEVNYYAIIDPVDYIRFNEYTSKYDMQALTITLRNYNSNYDLEKIKGTGSGEKIRYKIDEITFDKLKDIKEVKGFYAYAANEVIKVKNWKIENLLIELNYDKIGGASALKSADTLEMQIYNKTKNNKFSKITFAKGVNGEIADGKIIEPENNTNVRLTLDKEIQDKVCAILHEEEYKKYKQVGVLLMESSNGKIRAMSQKDDSAYNANLGYPSTNGAFPGSIFKVIVDEAGLDMNLIDNNKEYTINRDYPLEDPYMGQNQYTLAEALAHSSNNVFMQLGETVGLQNIYNYAKKQGMLGKVLNFQQEEIGKFEGDLLNPVVGDLSQTAIGQNVRITPLEAISIPSTIINNGIYVQPSLIDAYVNENNKILEKITPKITRILKKETAEKVKLHMMDVVNKGTGIHAAISGMDIGGKTGTTEDGETSDGWFVGFFNLHGKSYSMVVFVDNIDVNIEGKNDEEGGNTAAPLFKKVVNELNDIMDKRNN